MSSRVSAPSPFHRALAWVCAALVLGLAFVSASPGAHQWLHTFAEQHTCPDHVAPQPDPVSDEHACAVVLYASGVDTPLAGCAVEAPWIATNRLAPVVVAEIWLIAPRYLRQPERGPPAGWVV